MIEILNSIPDADPQAVIDNVKDGMAGFVKDSKQFDDTTMLCLRFKGNQIKNQK